MKPWQRHSYKILVAIFACALGTDTLPYLKDLVPQHTFLVLSVLGIIAQHIKQELDNDGKQVRSDNPQP